MSESTSKSVFGNPRSLFDFIVIFSSLSFIASYNDFGPAIVRRLLKSLLWSRIVHSPLFYPKISHFLTQLTVGLLLSPFTRPHSSLSSTTTYAAQIPNSASSALSSVHGVKAMTPSRCVPHSRCCIPRRVNRSPSIWIITARCSSSLNE